jgi:hypothetical protein
VSEEATYAEIQEAVKEVNIAFGTDQKFKNAPKKELILFLNYMCDLHDNNLPEYAWNVYERLPEVILEDEWCSAYGEGYDGTVQECKECMDESIVEATRCKILTRKFLDKQVKESLPAKLKGINKIEDKDIQPMTIMFDLMCKDPNMSIGDFRDIVNKTGFKYNPTSLKLVHRRVRKVVRLLKKYGHMK